MKKYLIPFVLGLLLISCAEEPLMEFADDHASVYFYINQSVAVNEIQKSFAATLDDEMLVNLPVRCSGLATDYDRYFKVAIDTGSTAVSGVDFAVLQDQYLFPAGAYEADLDVLIKKTELLSDSTLLLNLKLVASDDFALGEIARRTASIAFSDRLVQPDNWPSAYRDYSQVKHRVFLIITDLDEFPTPAEWSADFRYFNDVVARALSNYFRDNFPVYDENGNIINPW